MTTKLKIAVTLIGLCVAPFYAGAQSYWQVSYQGTATTNGTDKLDTRTTTENDFIEEAATKAGVPTTDLVLALHLNANELGDTLEVVNQNDPNLFHYEIFKFTYTFSGSPSQSYTNSAGTIKRFAYIFGNDDSHSRGSVILNESTSTDDSGGIAVNGVTGTVQFWRGLWQADAPDPNAVPCSGSFKTTKALFAP